MITDEIHNSYNIWPLDHWWWHSSPDHHQLSTGWCYRQQVSPWHPHTFSHLSRVFCLTLLLPAKRIHDLTILPFSSLPIEQHSLGLLPQVPLQDKNPRYLNLLLGWCPSMVLSSSFCETVVLSYIVRALETILVTTCMDVSTWRTGLSVNPDRASGTVSCYISGDQSIVEHHVRKIFLFWGLSCFCLWWADFTITCVS